MNADWRLHANCNTCSFYMINYLFTKNIQASTHTAVQMFCSHNVMISFSLHELYRLVQSQKAVVSIPVPFHYSLMIKTQYATGPCYFSQFLSPSVVAESGKVPIKSRERTKTGLRTNREKSLAKCHGNLVSLFSQRKNR